MASASPPASLLPPGLDLKFDNTIGVALLAAVLNAVLYGILCLQCFNFYQRFQRDNWILRYSVGALWVLDTLHLAFIVQCIYTYAVTNFGNVEQLLLIPWPISTSILVTGLTILLVQGWFGYRVWIMSDKNKLLTYPLVVVVIAAVCLSFANNIKLYFLPTFESFRNQLGLYYAEVTAFAVGDFYIAISLCYLLYQKRKGINHSYLQRTRSMLDTMMLYTIETGLLTSFVALASLICCATMSDNFVYVGVYLLLSGLYSNSLMASLNAREKFRQEATGQSTSIPLSNLTPHTNHGIAFASASEVDTGLGTVEMNVSHEVDYKRDAESKGIL